MRVSVGRVVTTICVAAPFLWIALAQRAAGFPVPEIEYAPSTYTAAHVSPAPVIDGSLDDPAWVGVDWTRPFRDIEGNLKPEPRFATRVKMAWDDTYFYVAAELEEPDLWATYTQRDAVIFHENDFEVFIDPDGDTHQYYEFEMNALNTGWDLLLVKPYRDGGPAVNAWDIAGLRTAVKLDGTINDPSDRDRGWTLEIAMPWAVLAECAHRPAPPKPGDRWYVNLSRVEWRREVVGGAYVKTKDPATGKDLPEDNWVWSPQGLIAMHYPERWGLVTFADAAGSAGETQGSQGAAALHAELRARDGLWRFYYAQKDYQEKHGRYASSLSELPPIAGPIPASVTFEVCGDGFDARIRAVDGSAVYAIREDGRCLRLPAH